MHSFRVIALSVVCFWAGQTVLAGPDWVEPPGEAGSLPGTSQVPGGGGRLASISGELGTALSVAASGGAADCVDCEDMYLIRICNPGPFCARTSAEFNSQLWLFDQNGRGLLANDDGVGRGTDSTLLARATDESPKTTLAPGLYYLAISGFDNDPQSDDQPIFNQQTRTEVSGPDGPGGLGVITNWSASPGAPAEGGRYLIFLEGVAFPGDNCANGPYTATPCVPAISEWGLLLTALLLPCAGFALLRRRNWIPN